MPWSTSTRILFGKPPRAIWSASTLLGLYRMRGSRSLPPYPPPSAIQQPTTSLRSRRTVAHASLILCEQHEALCSISRRAHYAAGGGGGGFGGLGGGGFSGRGGSMDNPIQLTQSPRRRGRAASASQSGPMHSQP
jgi:hypothetical protein